MVIFHNTFESYESCNEWNESFRSNTESISHLEFPRTENVSLTNWYATLFFAILTFKCLQFVTTGLEYGKKTLF